ncbi:GumC family protein [Puia dinghuensis]|uniref:Tyrosine protein kinase n=1 Tax=Puia dinghuensis TaxID=1792502 RepID=A0A8J2XVZ6_9BACT|nr:polysaccharide biosynthesis tyrosine autokinase [Puia dinghuensis]GGB20263.1 tyrosine protein kinase [Puia dinghuensis]
MNRMKLSKSAYIEKKETDLLQQALFRYLPYWPLFLAAVLFALIVGFIYLRYKTPLYEVTASILVKDEKKGLDDSKVEDALNLFGEKKIIENEIEVIRSRSIIYPIVTRLDLYAPVEERSGFSYRSAYLTSPVRVELEKPEDLPWEVSRVKFRYNGQTQTVATKDAAYPLDQWVVSPWGKIRFSKNPLGASVDTGRSFFFSLVNLPKMINQLQNGIEVSPSSKLSTVINISYKDAIPLRGEAILNELIDCYEQAAANDKNSTAANTLDFVEKRLQLVSKQLDDVESNVQKFRTENGIVDVSQQSNQYLQNVSENDQKMSEMDVQLSVLDQIESYIRSKQDQPGLVPTTLGIKDPMLSQLLEKLYDSEIQYDKLKKTTAENSPILLSVKNEIAKIKPSILENVRNQRNSIQAARNKLVSRSSQYNSLLNTLPEKERQLAEISRQHNIENSIYSFLLQKKEEATLAFSAGVSDSRIIDKAQSSIQPVSPKPWMAYMIALVLPIPLISVAISAREFLGNKVLFRRTIEESTVLPIIGELGYETSKKLLVIEKGERTFITEQFRNLRGSVASELAKRKGKTVMVTSSIAEEGKSFVAINLAVVFAAAGKRTVLVEADMYKPKLGSVFQLKEDAGLSGILNCPDVRAMWASSVDRATFYDNLFVFPSGKTPDNPSELLMSNPFNILMKELQDHFDIVIIDSVPVNPVPDAFTIARFADITLFVVRHGVTPKENLLLLDEDIKMQTLKNVNIVFNGIKRRGIATSGFGYLYGYGFSTKTGYGYYSVEEKRPVLF